jgi:hypothetical protein
MQDSMLHKSADPKILAQQTQLTTQVFHAINKTLNKTQDGNMSAHHTNHKGNKHNARRTPKPAWFDTAPTNQTYDVEGCTWHWFPKCDPEGKCKWVCNLKAAGHMDSYQLEHKPDHYSQATRDNKRPLAQSLPSPNITFAPLIQFLQQYQAVGDMDTTPPPISDIAAMADKKLDPDNY